MVIPRPSIRIGSVLGGCGGQTCQPTSIVVENAASHLSAPKPLLSTSSEGKVPEMQQPKGDPSTGSRQRRDIQEELGFVDLVPGTPWPCSDSKRPETSMNGRASCGPVRA
jgi:hypothetical protein